jgi:hypothetical protein
MSKASELAEKIRRHDDDVERRNREAREIADKRAAIAKSVTDLIVSSKLDGESHEREVAKLRKEDGELHQRLDHLAEEAAGDERVRTVLTAKHAEAVAAEREERARETNLKVAGALGRAAHHLGEANIALATAHVLGEGDGRFLVTLPGTTPRDTIGILNGLIEQVLDTRPPGVRFDVRKVDEFGVRVATLDPDYQPPALAPVAEPVAEAAPARSPEPETIQPAPQVMEPTPIGARAGYRWGRA